MSASISTVICARRYAYGAGGELGAGMCGVVPALVNMVEEPVAFAELHDNPVASRQQAATDGGGLAGGGAVNLQLFVGARFVAAWT